MSEVTVSYEHLAPLVDRLEAGEVVELTFNVDGKRLATVYPRRIGPNAILVPGLGVVYAPAPPAPDTGARTELREALVNVLRGTGLIALVRLAANLGVTEEIGPSSVADALLASRAAAAERRTLAKVREAVEGMFTWDKVTHLQFLDALDRVEGK